MTMIYLLLSLLLPLTRVESSSATLQTQDEHIPALSPLDVLAGECLDYRPKNEWWAYQWCYKDKIEQHHYGRDPMVPTTVNAVGTFQGESRIDPQSWTQTYQHEDADCQIEGSNKENIRRMATVDIYCCMVDYSNPSNKKRLSKSDQKHGTFIEKVEESSPCNYVVKVCSELVCTEEMKENIRGQVKRNQHKAKDARHKAGNQQDQPQSKTQKGKLKEPASIPPAEQSSLLAKPTFRYSFTAENNKPVSREEQLELRNRVKDMFYHGYNSYMDNAYPAADLKPISCKGGAFDLIKIPLVTLIDTLDTLVVLENYTEFKRAVRMIDKELPSFDFDVNISVFETTIRILGGLVSAHLMAIDPELKIYSGGVGDSYNDCLLRLAADMGDRLLPAFDTATGIPYGTVNLRSGVPKGETELASTAGAGSLVIEFEVLSCLTGDESFGAAARLATEALFERRSDLSLVGKHIHIRSGKWHETLSGVGSNSDSFYEYLLKAYLLFRRKEYYFMFQEVFQAVKDYSLQHDVWFNDVDMFSGKVRTRRSESLQAFWPGLEALLGMTQSSSSLLNAFYLVLKDFEFLPEEFDYVQWDIDKKKGNSVYYPLRPELIESTYMQYMTTRDRSWLVAGRSFLQAIETHARTECGYAAIKDITVMQMDDDMPSYFLSETCKYMYLLFDEENSFHKRHYIFSTEAHPFDTLQVGEVCTSRSHISDYEQGDLLQRVGADSVTDTTVGARTETNVYSLFNTMMEAFERQDAEYADEYFEPGTQPTVGGAVVAVNTSDPLYAVWREGRVLHQELLKCPKTAWWSSQSYHLPDSSHTDIAQRKTMRSKKTTKKEIEKVADKAGEKKSPAGNLLEMLKILSSQIQNVGKSAPGDHASEDEDEEDDDPLGICPFRDDPSRAMNQVHEESGGKTDRGVELNVGVLGSFSVNVFSDGFVITSQLFGNTMEISGIGQSSMFVKEYNTTHSSAVVALQHGEIATCDVHVDVKWGPFQDGEAVWGAKNYNEKFRPEELSKKRSCSFAAFGPTNNYVTFPTETISGPMTRLSSIESCQPPVQSVPDSTFPVGVAKEGSQEGGEDVDKDKDRDRDNRVGREAYSGQVVVVDRGSCMFEEKTIAAEKGGAEAVIVVNSEPALFMMAGLAQVVEGQPSGSEANELLSHIPTVMLSSTDGAFVTDAVQYLESRGMTASLSVDIVGLPAVLDTPLMGYTDHPTIRMSEKVIHIHGLGGWSALLTLSAEAQWQLFIVPSSELNVITPWNVQTSHGHPFCTNSDFALDPVKSYLQLIHERCPSFVLIKDGKVIEIKKR